MPCTGATAPERAARQLILPLYNITQRDLDFFFLRQRMSIRLIAKRTGHDREAITAGINRVFSAFAQELSDIGYKPPCSDFNEWKITVKKQVEV